jgi:hypothetical protein
MPLNLRNSRVLAASLFGPAEFLFQLSAFGRRGTLFEIVQKGPWYSSRSVDLGGLSLTSSRVRKEEWSEYSLIDGVSTHSVG